MARLLTAEADRLLDAVSSADDVQCLLDADGALERTLSYALCSEMIQIDDIRTQTAKHCP